MQQLWGEKPLNAAPLRDKVDFDKDKSVYFPVSFDGSRLVEGGKKKLRKVDR